MTELLKMAKNTCMYEIRTKHSNKSADFLSNFAGVSLEATGGGGTGALKGVVGTMDLSSEETAGVETFAGSTASKSCQQNNHNSKEMSD